MAQETGVVIEDVEFASADGASTIRARFWMPDGAAPRAVVQVVHGMSEHIRRYDEFARFLVAQGYAVCGDDHIGHGASAPAHKHGCMPAKDGNEVLIADEHALRGIAAKKCPGVAHVFFGHSMGSFITRCYLGRYGEVVAAAVICGTGTVPVATSRAGNALARAVAATRGEDHRSKLIDTLGAGAYAKAVPGPTGYEWLSHNKDNVQAYLADDECGFMFSAGGYVSLTALTAEACSRKCAENVPHDLPLLYIGGDGDPVGNMGRGVEAAAQLARDAGSADVTCKVYENMRHEILNETGHEKVFEDVASWLGRTLTATNGGAQ
ncbi:alpha/beta fold hydrolase [Paratractidigestivibacter sp.]|uniref:alpha/beta fold hydrolase n=1 Tax=Paratractidigestivibacter sp. TaxID=2847316 RepID=UPI002ABE7D2F|nr:alpha/beta fold hydrolase [Paratractidigestivibacter sp.]